MTSIGERFVGTKQKEEKDRINGKGISSKDSSGGSSDELEYSDSNRNPPWILF